jgi:hypothetical protein
MCVGLVPKLSLRGECSITAFKYIFTRRDKQSGACVFHATCRDRPEIQLVMQHFGYRGEDFPNATWYLVRHLICKKERKWLTGEEKHEVLVGHGYKYASCDGPGPFEFDHVMALSTTFGEQVFQPLCGSCRNTKTAEQPRNYECDAFASHLNLEAYDGYVMSFRPPPSIQKTRQIQNVEGCLLSDVRRCRARC